MGLDEQRTILKLGVVRRMNVQHGMLLQSRGVLGYWCSNVSVTQSSNRVNNLAIWRKLPQVLCNKSCATIELRVLEIVTRLLGLRDTIDFNIFSSV